MAPLQRVTIYLTDKEMDIMEKKCRDCEKAFGFRPTTKQQGDMYKHAFFVHRETQPLMIWGTGVTLCAPYDTSVKGSVEPLTSKKKFGFSSGLQDYSLVIH